MLARQTRSRPISGPQSGIILISVSPYLAGTISAPIFNLKVKKLTNQSIAVAFSAKATTEGELHNPDAFPKPHSSAREYETPSVRVSILYFCSFQLGLL